jgi:hypothetical protein
MSKWVLGIIALVAGVIILFGWISLQWVVGIFLIIWGIFTLLGKK